MPHIANSSPRASKATRQALARRYAALSRKAHRLDRAIKAMRSQIDDAIREGR